MLRTASDVAVMLVTFTRDLQEEQEEEQAIQAKRVLPNGVEVFELYGTLFFGAVDQFTESMRFLEKTPRVLILETRNLLAIDASGLHAPKPSPRIFPIAGPI
jgi:SulP family sulfate permease